MNVDKDLLHISLLLNANWTILGSFKAIQNLPRIEDSIRGCASDLMFMLHTTNHSVAAPPQGWNVPRFGAIHPRKSPFRITPSII